MHAVRLAEMFGIRSVAVPFAAGVASAVGLVGADLARRARADPRRRPRGRRCRLSSRLRSPSSPTRRAPSSPTNRAATFEVTRSADVRYRGQAYHLTLPVPDPPLAAADVDAARRRASAQRFEDTYGIALDLPTQIHNLRVHVVRVVDKFAPRAPSLDGRRRVRRARR